MDDYLSKPIHLGSLYGALARWAPDTKPEEPEKPCSALPAVDRRMLLSRVDGDERLLAELVVLFGAESPRLIGEIRKALSTGDAGALKDAAHALKGSAASMAVDGVKAAAGILECMADSCTLDGAPAALVNLEREFLRSIGALNAMIGTETT
jgi:HPt (histidine-containing phosphotransfer) domain-containing protein